MKNDLLLFFRFLGLIETSNHPAVMHIHSQFPACDDFPVTEKLETFAQELLTKTSSTSCCAE